MTNVPATNDHAGQLEIVVRAFVELHDEQTTADRLGLSLGQVKALLASKEANVILLHFLRGKIFSLGSKAIETLKDLLDNPERGQTRLNAAKTILDRIGLIPPKASDPDRGKGLEDMNRDELHAVIRNAERVLGDRATPVTPANEPQPLDFLD